MKRLILPLLLSQAILADCSQNQREQAQGLWQQSQTMQGVQKSQALSNALQTCPLSQIKVDFYLDAIENQLNQGELTLETLNALKKDLSDALSINNNLSIRNIRNRNNTQIQILTDEIASIENKIQTNQEELKKLQEYKDNNGIKRAFGSGERLMLPVLFSNGSSRVGNNRKIRNLIERMEATLKEDKNAEFSITGYASSRGRARGNKKLSEKRAYNTQKYLEKYITRGHISTSGSGESDLICNGGYPVNKGNNEYQCKYGTENEASSRRIEIFRRR